VAGYLEELTLPPPQAGLERLLPASRDGSLQTLPVLRVREEDGDLAVMYLHRDSRLIYLANPRTGSTATATALMGIGFEKVGRHHEAVKVGKGWVSFGVVRNHWDAALSWVLAHNYPMTVESLRKALDNEYVSENKMWGYHSPDFLLRYEKLEQELNDFLFAPVKLPRENVSTNRKGRHYREFYDAETRCYIWDRFKDEIEALGYEW